MKTELEITFVVASFLK